MSELGVQERIAQATSTYGALQLQQYEVLPGDTGYSIARRYGVHFRHVQAANPGVDLSRIRPKQRINLPLYRVQYDDTTYNIGLRTGLSSEEIDQVNPRIDDITHIEIGWTVFLPLGPDWVPASPAGAAPASAPAPQPPARKSPATRPSSPSTGVVRGLNAIVTELSSSGAGSRTLESERMESWGGVRASTMLAHNDYDHVMRMRSKFEQASQQTGVPPAILAAIASRETHGGTSLRPSGYSKFKKDGEGEYGVMQVDPDRHGEAVTGAPPASLAHILKAAQVYMEFYELMKSRVRGKAAQHYAAIAAYNAGRRRMDYTNPDAHTTGEDYASDVWVRAQYFARNWYEHVH